MRWEILIQYPELFEFLNAAYTETASDIRPCVELRNKGLTQDALGKILRGSIVLSLKRTWISTKRSISSFGRSMDF